MKRMSVITRTHIAKVSLTDAIYKSSSGAQGEALAAKNYLAKHKEGHCFCAECFQKGHKVQLRYSSGSDRVMEMALIDPETMEPIIKNGEPVTENRQYITPAHFTRWPGTAKHVCWRSGLDDLRSAAFKSMALRRDGFRWIFKLNIPGTINAHPVHVPHLSTPRRLEHAGNSRKIHCHDGIQSAEELSALVHNVGETLLKEQMFWDGEHMRGPLDVFCYSVQSVLQKLNSRPEAPLAFKFQALGRRDLWSEYSDGLQIPGQATQMKAPNGNNAIRPNVKLQFNNEDLYRQACAMVNRNGTRSAKDSLVLVFGRIDGREALAAKQNLLNRGLAGDKAVSMIMHITHPEQMAVWDKQEEPESQQLSFDLQNKLA